MKLWHDGWHETHAPLAPPELVERRTMDDFRSRIGCRLPLATVAELDRKVVGFCSIKESQIDQLYLARPVWGSGMAQALLDDGLARLARRGVDVAWLICAIGNHRAARFYEKMGWTNTGVVPVMTETSNGPMAVNGWRMERTIDSPEEVRQQDAYAVLIHVGARAHRAHRALAAMAGA
ncbi:MAG: GNAT family N-acetyltransferase [Rhodospirillaceae bacterium]|nr:GNAT family N-acetyltransferase [Rhodospirillaceae bacterium]